mmetsp:Transcript_43145/g.101116  ORF Transcript_43145/g.101116 Transcript_43145/m.101116 type:complete len:218 (+) Transcript_43145:373-1026(+)
MRCLPCTLTAKTRCHQRAVWGVVRLRWWRGLRLGLRSAARTSRVQPSRSCCCSSLRTRRGTPTTSLPPSTAVSRSPSATTATGSRSASPSPTGYSACSSYQTTRCRQRRRGHAYRRRSPTPTPSTTSPAQRCSSTASPPRSLIRCAWPWRTPCIRSTARICSLSSPSSRTLSKLARMAPSSAAPARQCWRSRAALASATLAATPCPSSLLRWCPRRW